MTDRLHQRLAVLLATLPDETGGLAVIAAIDSSPPAMAMLSTGHVVLDGDTVKLVTEARSSIATATPRTSASILIADEVTVLRASIAPLITDVYEHLAVLSGRLISIRPSVEMPWSLQLSFVPSGRARREPFLDYWHAVRTWVLDGCRGSPPPHPRLQP